MFNRRCIVLLIASLLIAGVANAEQLGDVGVIVNGSRVGANNPLPTGPVASGSGTDASSPAGSATLATITGSNTLLATVTVTHAGQYYALNATGQPAYAALDDGAGNQIGVLPLAQGAGAGQQGAALDIIPWFTGRIRVYGQSVAGGWIFARGN